MATWLIWPHGPPGPDRRARPQLRRVPGRGRGGDPALPALRHRRRRSTARSSTRALTVLLAAAYAATALLLGTALGSGSAWATAGATLRRRGRLPPAARAACRTRVDRRFNRARYDGAAAHGRVPRGPARGPRGARGDRGAAARALRDPRLELRFLLPESEVYVDARGLPVAAATTGARGRRSCAAARRSRWSCTGRRGPQRPTCCASWWRRAGWRSRSRACGSSCAASSRRSRPRARGSSPPATRSAGGSSATCTTARSSGSSRSGSRCATPSTSSAGPPERGDATLDDAVAELAARSTSCASWPTGCRPSQLDAGLAPALRELAGRAPLPVEVDATARALHRRARGGRLLHRLRGADQRRQARAGRHGRRSARPAATASSSSRVADDGIGGAAPAGLRAARPAPTASPRTAARCSIDSAPARHDPDRGAAVRVVIAEDQVLLREGLARLFAGRRPRGRRVARRRRRPAAAVAGAPPRPGRPRHPDAADVHRRGRPRRARDQATRTPTVGVLVLSQHIETSHAVELVALGGFGYLLKDRVLDVGEFLAAAERVAPAARRSTRRSSAASLGPRRPATRSAQLTDREREVLELMAEGLTNAGIAERLVPQRAHRRGPRPPRADQARHARERGRPSPRARRARPPRTSALTRHTIASRGAALFMPDSCPRDRQRVDLHRKRRDAERRAGHAPTHCDRTLEPPARRPAQQIRFQRARQVPAVLQRPASPRPSARPRNRGEMPVRGRGQRPARELARPRSSAATSVCVRLCASTPITTRASPSIRPPLAITIDSSQRRSGRHALKSRESSGSHQRRPLDLGASFLGRGAVPAHRLPRCSLLSRTRTGSGEPAAPLPVLRPSGRGSGLWTGTIGARRGVHGVDDPGVVDAREVDRGDRLRLVWPGGRSDDDQRHAFAGHLDGVRVSQLVRRKPPSHAGLAGALNSSALHQTSRECRHFHASDRRNLHVPEGRLPAVTPEVTRSSPVAPVPTGLSWIHKAVSAASEPSLSCKLRARRSS